MRDTLDNLIRTFFDLKVMADVFPDLLTRGLPNTLLLTAGAVAIGLVFGLILAILLLSARWWLSFPAKVIVDILRGVPGLLVIFVIGFGLPIAGITFLGRDAYPYAMIAVGITEGAYMAEIIRAGIQSIDKGQTEASRSLGISSWQTMRSVVLPQGLRRVLPPMTGQVIITLKATSLVYVLGLMPDQQEIFAVAQSGTSQYATMSPMVMAGIMYLVITVPLTHLVNAWDKRMRSGRRSAPAAAAMGASHEV